ncbi:Gag protease polyprotein-like protein [Gossypium australe]|uniref:Gag protease polyprotein-like protein n=1 Tax=Gossypium australe TaxID=47621 RepID=A0A5B6WHM1_9ROSI|nr:Gag protease polyprotein-like protein [Gossypium australe]
MSTYQKGRRLGQNNTAGTTRMGEKDTVVRSENRAPTRTYAIRAREEAASPDVIPGTFYLFDVTVYALVDPGSTQSYICTALVTQNKLHSMIVNLVCCKCPLKVTGCEFPTDLMLLPFREFDVILGMDWLSLHDVVVNYRQKQIDLKYQMGEIISVESNGPNSVRLIRKGSEVFPAYILDTRHPELKLHQLPTVSEYTDVFPKELLGLPPDREVEFVIDLVPRIAPISI